MSNSTDRRGFLKAAAAAGAALGIGQFPLRQVLAAPLAEGAPNAEKLGWRLGCQAYSFNRFTFFDAIDKIASRSEEHTSELQSL